MLAVLLLTQDLHCLLVYALSSSSPPTLLTFLRHYLFLLFFSFLSLCCLSSSPLSIFSLSAANTKQQPLDAAVFHLLPPHRQLLCAQHVCGRGGGKLSQVSPAAGGGGGAAERGETAETAGEEEEK